MIEFINWSTHSGSRDLSDDEPPPFLISIVFVFWFKFVIVFCIVGLNRNLLAPGLRCEMVLLALARVSGLRKITVIMIKSIQKINVKKILTSELSSTWDHRASNDFFRTDLCRCYYYCYSHAVTCASVNWSRYYLNSFYTTDKVKWNLVIHLSVCGSQINQDGNQREH